jgi:transketolase
MNIFCPADGEELAEALPSLIASNEPWYIRYYSGTTTITHVSAFEIGKAEVYYSASAVENEVDVTILTYGFLLSQALKAQKLLQSSGITVDVVNLRTLAPVDESVILESADRSTLVVTLEDHLLIGGLHSIVAELFLQHGMNPEVLPIALDGRWFKPALLADVLLYEGFTGSKIAERIRACLAEIEATESGILRDLLTLN